jgi:hypothetical protein
MSRIRTRDLGLALCLTAAGCLAGEAPDDADAVPSAGPVNTALGDESWRAAFGSDPGRDADEVVRLRTHLAHVEGLLRARDTAHLSAAQRLARVRNLDRLHDYWTAGLFPASDIEGARRPRFVDDDADAPLAWASETRLCAVGHLLAADLGADAARAVAAEFQHAAVGDMRSDVLDAWAATSGLDRDELAAIQPSYRFRRPQPAPVRLDPATVRSLLHTREAQVNACVHDRLGPNQAHPARIDARVTVAMDGRVTAVALATGLDRTDDLAVQACVAGVVSELRFPRFRGEAVTASHAFSIIGPTAGGRLNPAYLAVIFRRAEPEVRACAAMRAASERAPMEVAVIAHADPRGFLTDVEVLSTGRFAELPLEHCVRRAMQRLELPRFSGAAQRTSHAFHLAP